MGQLPCMTGRQVEGWTVRYAHFGIIIASGLTWSGI